MRASSHRYDPSRRLHLGALLLIVKGVDIKPDNILLDVVDNSIFEAFVQHEFEVPTPRKRVNRRTIYASKCFHPPNMLRSVKLCDMGSAVEGKRYRNHNAQPDFFRAPEVVLKAPWSYPIDIWNLGAMVSF